MEEKEEAQEVALRGRLREAAAASEEAERELTAREAERAKLLELLEFKETRLQRQSLATRRLRDALGAAKGSAAYYLARTAVRGWRQLLRFGEARRGLERAKERRAELAIRQGCGLMRAALCRAVGRRRQAALHGLWLHAAGQRLQEDFEGEKDELTRQAVHEGGRSGLGLVAIQVPEDQVLFGTPRKKEEAKSPSHLRSPFSEASTRATRTTALRISAPASSAGAARLGLALGKALVFRLGFAWRRLGQARDKRRAQLLLQQQEDWRQGAEQRLVELAKKGQRAERQREALRQKCQAAQQGCGAAERRAARLRTQLAEAEQATEALSRRAKQLERAASATPPRGVRLKRAKEERLTSLAKAREEVRRLRLALHEARSAAPGEHELCRDLRAGWQRERDQWAEACEELRRRTASAQEAARAARHAEAEAQAEATAAKAEAEAQAQLDPELRRLKSQLEGLCSQAAKAKGDLEAHVLEGTPDAEGESQSEEVAAYEALVSRLRSELRWEKSQRMACDQALETLRGSYGLLLSRAAAR